MGKRFLEKLWITFCVMLGCMTGYGVVHFTGIGGGNSHNIISHTEDNTLDKEKNSVFFSSKEEVPKVTLKAKEELQEEYIALELVTEEDIFHKEEKELEVVTNPMTIAESPEVAEEIEEKQTIGQALLVTPMIEQVSDLEESFKDDSEAEKEQEEEKIEIEAEKIEEKEWKANEILAKGIRDKVKEEEIKTNEVNIKEEEIERTEMVAEVEIMPYNEVAAEKEKKQIDVTQLPQENELAQVFTYPKEIFGQTPVVNRSDEYVTYFEFALDLIETVEAEVKEKGLSETALLAKFVVKALFCGVDVKTIKINEPISRSEAALALWLTAQVMEEKGTETSGMSYVTDLGNCSSSEKKAIAYLYEQGVISGYQIKGQTFSPSSDLKTKDGATWMSKIKQCWK